MDEPLLDDSLLPEVWKSTRLIDAQVDLPPLALKLFAYSVTRLRGTEHGVRSVTFSANELAALICDERNGKFSYELRAAAEKLTTTAVRIPKWDRGGQEAGWTVTALAAGITYDKGSSTVKVSFSEEITPHVVHLRTRFARLDLLTVMKLRSKYAHRFYEMCKSRERDVDPAGNIKTWTVTLQGLRAWLVLRPATTKKPAEYGRYVDLERRILLPAERELSRLAGMLLSHREIKRERKVVALEFSLSHRHAPGAESAAIPVSDVPVSDEELPFDPDPVQSSGLSCYFAEKENARLPESTSPVAVPTAAPAKKSRLVRKSKSERPDLLPALLEGYSKESVPNNVTKEQSADTKAWKRVQFCRSNWEVHCAAGTTDPELLNMCVLELVAAEHELHELLTRDLPVPQPPEPEDDPGEEVVAQGTPSWLAKARLSQ